jgi:hypothetical protein
MSKTDNKYYVKYLDDGLKIFMLPVSVVLFLPARCLASIAVLFFLPGFACASGNGSVCTPVFDPGLAGCPAAEAWPPADRQAGRAAAPP